ncbi:serine/arginine repetitive matrix protein 3-like [Schistocerca cancellata]|uniref:serine/arginine repetitive matrix protein 3-like n=1 Tax=Schistocerca cancellata TaxID=274614 RepID=UPI0021190295|nr:serine/arginine repetitive matrix protein 3-like [Schistocerca cancellata]
MCGGSRVAHGPHQGCRPTPPLPPPSAPPLPTATATPTPTPPPCRRDAQPPSPPAAAATARGHPRRAAGTACPLRERTSRPDRLRPKTRERDPRRAARRSRADFADVGRRPNAADASVAACRRREKYGRMKLSSRVTVNSLVFLQDVFSPPLRLAVCN